MLHLWFIYESSSYFEFDNEKGYNLHAHLRSLSTNIYMYNNWIFKCDGRLVHV